MPAKLKKTSSLNLAKKIQRQVAINEGFYDGRFRQRTLPDKKKEESKRKARVKVSPDKEL